MSWQYEYFGTLKDGKLSLPIKKMEQDTRIHPDCRVFVRIEKYRSKRSNQQLRYYWMLIGMIRDKFQDDGIKITKDAVHEYLKHEYLYEEIINHNTGEVQKFPLSLAEKGGANKAMLMDYIEDIKRHAAEHWDLVLPDANEQLEIT